MAHFTPVLAHFTPWVVQFPPWLISPRATLNENDRNNRKLLLDRQEKSAEYYNKSAAKSFKLCNPGDMVVYKDGPNDKTWHRAKVVSVDREFRSYTLLNSIGNFITRNRSHVLPDKTGRGFFVSHDQVFDALQTPTPAPDPPKTCNPRPISQTVVMPEGNRPTASKFLSTPPPTKKVITIPIKKSTMPPEIVDKYRAMSNMCYDKPILRRSKRIADKAARSQK